MYHCILRLNVRNIGDTVLIYIFFCLIFYRSLSGIRYLQKSTIVRSLDEQTDEVGSINHVFMENVGKIVTTGMIQRVRESFESRGFSFSYIMINAAQCGAPHLRRRCYMIATKNIDALKEIHQQYENKWSFVPDNMVESKDNDHLVDIRRRSGMCGNSIVHDDRPEEYIDSHVEALKLDKKDRKWIPVYMGSRLS